MAVATNSIGLITKYSPEYFDKVYKQEAVTSVFDANKESIKFTGAKTVKIGKLQLGGLGNYYRNNDQVANKAGDQAFYGSAGFGYQRSALNYVWEEFTLDQDRAAAFPIEYFDDEEAGDEVVGRVVTEVSRTVIVPEVDAYALSRIAEAGIEAGGKATGYSNAPLAALNAAFEYFENNEVPAEDQVIFASPTFMKALRETQEVQRFLGEEVRDRGVNYKITTYEGRDIITVSPRRLHTGFVSYEGGYDFSGAGAAPINFLACAKSAIYHVVKYEKVKIISGDLNLAANGFDGYTVYARIYHGVLIPDNKKVAIYVNIGSAASTALVDFHVDLEATTNKVKKITINPGDVLGFVATGTPSGKTLGGSVVILKEGDVPTKSAKYYVIDSNKRIISDPAGVVLVSG